MRFSEYCIKNGLELDSNLISFIMIVIRSKNSIKASAFNSLLDFTFYSGLKTDSIDLEEDKIKFIIDSALRYKKNAAFI